MAPSLGNRFGDFHWPATDEELIYSNVLAPEDGEYQLVYGGLAPGRVYTNGKGQLPNKMFSLKKGVNEIVIRFESHGTAYCVERKVGDKPRVWADYQAERPLSMRFRGDASLLPCDLNRTQEPSYDRYRFTAAPR